MKLQYVFVFVFVLTGCSTAGVCDYSLSEGGWRPIDNPPRELVNEFNKDNFWFVGPDGDYFACSTLRKKGVCGSVYELFELQPDGTFKDDHIVCIE